MKLLFLADLNSAHTEKWARELAGRGYEVGIFTLNQSDTPWWKDIANLQVYDSAVISRSRFSGNGLLKLLYLTSYFSLKQVIRDFKPDIIHAHYATSYGLLGAMSGAKPFIISVWGSDVMDFPNRSFLHKKLLQFNFRKANLLLATSYIIAECIAALTDKKTEVVHFGIDTTVFTPLTEPGESNDQVVIGTVKSLEAIYGIDILLNAFSVLSTRLPDRDLRLLIVGGGTLEAEYKNLAVTLGIAAKVEFTGKIPFAQVPAYYRKMDIFANLSHNESFGVSVLEAEACAIPVVVTAVGGLKEVILPQKTGFAVKTGNVQEAAAALEKLVLNKELRKDMGQAGRRFVMGTFQWDECVARMEQVYKNVRNE